MKAKYLWLVALLTLLLSLPSFALAQDNGARSSGVVKPGEKNSEVVNPAPPAQRHYYRLNFVLRESDEGKTLNQREFTMNVSADPDGGHDHTSWSLRAGTKIPVNNAKDTTNYIDVGVNIDIWAKDSDSGALQLEVTSAISSVAPETANSGSPTVRDLKVRGAVLAPLGKPTLVFTSEDPASQHQFELQVTPTRAK